MTIKLKSKFNWFLTDEFKELRGKLFISSDMLKEKYPPRTRSENENEENTEESVAETERVPYSDSDEHAGGGEKPFNISQAISREPNGGNYERKGFSNMFICQDCGLCSFQSAIENHVCVAWQESQTSQKQTEIFQDDDDDDDKKDDEEKQKSKSDSGEWLLDK